MSEGFTCDRCEEPKRGTPEKTVTDERVDKVEVFDRDGFDKATRNYRSKKRHRTPELIKVFGTLSSPKRSDFKETVERTKEVDYELCTSCADRHDNFMGGCLGFESP